MPKVSAIDKIIQPFNLNKQGTMIVIARYGRIFRGLKVRIKVIIALYAG